MTKFLCVTSMLGKNFYKPHVVKNCMGCLDCQDYPGTILNLSKILHGSSTLIYMWNMFAFSNRYTTLANRLGQNYMTKISLFEQSSIRRSNSPSQLTLFIWGVLFL